MLTCTRPFYPPSNRPSFLSFCSHASSPSRPIHMTDDTIQQGLLLPLLPLPILSLLFSLSLCSRAFPCSLPFGSTCPWEGKEGRREGRVSSKNSHPDIIGSRPCCQSMDGKEQKRALCKLSFNKEDHSVLCSCKKYTITAISSKPHPSRITQHAHKKHHGPISVDINYYYMYIITSASIPLLCL